MIRKERQLTGVRAGEGGGREGLRREGRDRSDGERRGVRLSVSTLKTRVDQGR